MKPIMVSYGSIPLGGKLDFDFCVFEREIDIFECVASLQASLGDGRFVVGATSSKSWWKKFFQFFYQRRFLQIKAKEQFKFQGSVDESTKKEILEKFLTRRCVDCKEPTIYQVSFTTFRHSFGSMGYSVPVCLKHLNKTIKKENHDWVVYESENALLFGDYKNLGRVTYNHESQRFEQASSGPLVEQVYPESMSFSVDSKVIFDFNKETGVLELGEPNLFDQFKQKLGKIPKEGISIELFLPFSEEPTVLSGVKSLEFAQRGK